jgi:hypothetical protein
VTEFEIISTALLLVMLGVVGGVAFQIRAIAREMRGEARGTRAYLVAGVERIDTLEHAVLQAMREALEGHEKVAAATIAVAEALPKPHRPIWKFSSKEQTNGVDITYFVCTVGGCRDVMRVGPGDPDPSEDQD